MFADKGCVLGAIILGVFGAVEVVAHQRLGCWVDALASRVVRTEENKTLAVAQQAC